MTNANQELAEGRTGSKQCQWDSSEAKYSLRKQKSGSAAKNESELEMDTAPY